MGLAITRINNIYASILGAEHATHLPPYCGENPQPGHLLECYDVSLEYRSIIKEL